MTAPSDSSRARGISSRPTEESGLDNVTLGSKPADEGRYFPCPICRRWVRVGQTKRRKPYLVCDACGVQLFVRGKEGIRRFQGMLGEAPMLGDSREVITVLDHFAALKRKLEELEASKSILPVFAPADPDLETQARLVRREMAKLRRFMKIHLRRSKAAQ